MLDWKNKNIHVVGVSGIEGFEIMRFLIELGCTSVTAHDFSDETSLARSFALAHPSWSGTERKDALQFLKSHTSKIHYKNTYLEGLQNADLIFASQAWYRYPQNYPLLDEAYTSGVPVRTIMHIYLNFFNGTTIGITGSNGKSTTTHILTEIFKNCIAKKLISGNLFTGGNERGFTQSLQELQSSSENDVLVLEISNRHLKFFGDDHVDIAGITNITKNHISEHGTFEKYAKAKTRLLNGAIGIIRAVDEKLVKSHLKSAASSLNVIKKTDEICGLTRDDLPLRGEHNFENILMATELFKTFLKWKNIPLSTKMLDCIATTLKTLEGVPKRLEILGESKGVTIVNDLSSTTAISTEYALRAFPEKTSLIIGGDHKGDDFDELIALCDERYSKGTLHTVYVLPGSIKKMLTSSMGARPYFKNCNSLQDVRDELYTFQKNKTTNLLISPAGESFISTFLVETTLEKIFGIKR